MAKIGTKNGSNGRERDFVKRQESARARSAVERAKREERLGIPHADARDLAKTTPEGLSQHESKIHNDGKTRVVKRCVNAFVEPNAH